VSEYAEFADEVMTYAPVRNLGREVAELEAQRRQLQIDYAQLKAERDELEARLSVADVGLHNQIVRTHELEAQLNAAIVAAVYQEVQDAGR
jgi:predicted nuclease with TOPRIM domain